LSVVSAGAQPWLTRGKDLAGGFENSAFFWREEETMTHKSSQAQATTTMADGAARCSCMPLAGCRAVDAALLYRSNVYRLVKDMILLLHYS